MSDPFVVFRMKVCEGDGMVKPLVKLHFLE